MFGSSFGRSSLAAACLALASLATPLSRPAAAEQRAIPSTHISIDVPDGFEEGKGFTGFVNPLSGASIVALEMPAHAFTELTSEAFFKKLQNSGFAKVERGKLERADHHLFLTAEQATAVGPVSKFLLIIGHETVTAFLTINVLKSDIESGKTTVASISRILESVSISSAPSAPPPATFGLNYLGPFKSAGLIAGSQAYSLDGLLMPPDKKTDLKRAGFFVGQSIDAADETDLIQLCRAALLEFYDLERGKILQEGLVSIAELTGCEIEFDGPQRKSGINTVVYNVILMQPDRHYIRMIGFTGVDGEKLLPEFRKMAASFHFLP